jgi:hypothetical protein
VLNRVLNSSSEPQSSTTYRSFVQRYRECERNAGVQWSIDFNPHPRPWHAVSDDIIYAGSEMNVDTDEFLKSLKSLQVSPCECSAKNPGLGLPNQHTKACPRFQAMHCWCPPATGPGQPHLSSCSHFKRPVITHAFIGSYHDWDLTEPWAEPESGPGQYTKKYGQYTKIDPEAWTFGKMAAKMIADAVAAAESETGGQGALPAAEIAPEPPEIPPELAAETQPSDFEPLGGPPWVGPNFGKIVA